MRLIIVFWLLLGALPAAAADAIGGVAAIRGEVSVVRGDEWSAAAPGMRLERADRIVTGANGRALLQLDGGLAVTVGANTELQLEHLHHNPQAATLTGWLDLIKGLVRGVLTAPGTTNEIEIQTPLALTSVRSTEWTVEHDSEHTAVLCLEGEVVVAANGVSVTLPPGDGTDIRGPTSPNEPVAWGAQRVASTVARSSFAVP